MLTITFEDTTQISALAPFGTVFINAALAKNPPAVSVMAYGDERDAILEKMPALAVWDELYEVLSDKLSGTPGIEHEWEGDEYDKLISFRPYPLGDTVNVPLAAS